MELERYHDAMERVPFDPNLEKRVLSRLVEARGADQPSRMASRPRRRVLAVALAAALCLAVTAGAYGTLSGWFTPLFESHPEIIDQTGTPLSASATDAGYTITANALFGDKNCLYVAMALTREDGGRIDSKGLNFPLRDVGFQIRNGGYYAYALNNQGVTDRVSISVKVENLAEIPLGETMTLTFDRLTQGAGDTEVVLAEGNWRLSIPIRYTDLTQTIALDSPISVGETGVALDRVEFSPLSVVVFGEGGPISQDQANRVMGLLDSRGVVLNLRDGTTVDLMNGAGMSHSQGITRKEDGSYRVFVAAVLPDLITLNEMECFTVCGMDIPLDFPAE